MNQKNELYLSQLLDKHTNQIKKSGQRALKAEDIPVCTLILDKDDQVVSYGVNDRYRKRSITGHAEINAINKAIKKLKSVSLNECTLLSTLEPCMMCVGAIKQANIKTIYFYASSPKNGFLFSNHVIDLSKFKIANIDNEFTKRYKVTLLDFFKKLRP